MDVKDISPEEVKTFRPIKIELQFNTPEQAEDFRDIFTHSGITEAFQSEERFEKLIAVVAVALSQRGFVNNYTFGKFADRLKNYFVRNYFRS